MKKEIKVVVVAVSVVTPKIAFPKAPFTGDATLSIEFAPELEGVTFVTGAYLRHEQYSYHITGFRGGCATGEQVVAIAGSQTGVVVEFYLDVPTSSSPRADLRDKQCVWSRFVSDHGRAPLDGFGECKLGSLGEFITKATQQ